jgi:hypothetical protein
MASTYSNSRRMQVTEAGVMQVKVWRCSYCYTEFIQNPQPEHHCDDYPIDEPEYTNLVVKQAESYYLRRR